MVQKNFSFRLIYGLLLGLLLGGMLPFPVSANSSAPVPPTPLRPQVSTAVRSDVSPALRDLAALPQSQSARPRADAPESDFALPRRWPLEQNWSDPLRQSVQGVAAMPEPLYNFEGVTNVDGVLPPDTQGDIGYDPATGKKYYVQWINSSFAIWDVTTATPVKVVGPVAGNSIWQGFGGVCENTNDGDPITLYDTMANRWLMSQFSVNGPYYQCIAISQTADPTGSWYRYAFLVSNNKMNDYPHFGVWPDGYYMTVNQFTNGASWGGAGVFAFNRTKMLAGDPSANFIYFDLGNVDLNWGGMLPSDLDGSTLPPTGSPNYFVEVDDLSAGDEMKIWRFHADWANPANATFGNNGQPNFTLPVAAWSPFCSGRSCIPQPGTSVGLDGIDDRLMYRLAYRNFGDHESLVVNHTVNAGGMAGVRWYEVRNLIATPTIYQQGTFAPDSTHRWMGSIAMDAQGNMALGYSVSSSSVYPSIRYTGRLNGDPLGQMTQGETTLIAGGGSQTHSANRWGDYSMMGIDPVDDCTFWFTTEYMAATSSSDWQTRIGAFRFPNCNAAQSGRIAGRVTDSATHLPLAGAHVAAQADKSPVATVTDASGNYRLDADEGVYTITANAYGYYPFTQTDVEVTAAQTTTLNFTMQARPSYQITGVVRDAQAGWPLYARITIAGSPTQPADSVVWSNPHTGAYTLTLASGATYTLTAEALTPGYYAGSVTYAALSAPASHDFDLRPNAVACNAPGYSGEQQGVTQSFDAGTLPAGWQVVDNAGGGAVWRFDDPNARTNRTGGAGAFAIADSDYHTGIAVDTELRSPQYTVAGWPGALLEFKTDFRWYAYGADERAAVDVRLDGDDWINVWELGGSSARGPRTVRVDLTPYLAGKSTLQVRFRYYGAENDWWWQVDDVFVGRFDCVAAAGGLVVGTVQDANTSAPVLATLVSSDATAAAVLANDVAFYSLFAPAGAATITATASGYAPLTFDATAVQSQTVRHDLSLAAGRLALSGAADLDVVVVSGGSAARVITLTNTGGAGAAFEVQETDTPPASAYTGPFAPARRRVSPKYLNALDASTVRIYTPPSAPLLDAGQVLRSWETGLTAPWGLVVMPDGSLWVNDVRWGNGSDRLYHFLPDGAATGESVQLDAPIFAADMAYDPQTDAVWQVNVGEHNCITALDAATLRPNGGMICPPFGSSARGLAYDPTTQTFFAGSWNDSNLYHFDARGYVLAAVDTHLNIAGLAYNPTTGHLFVLSNSTSGYDAYVLDARHNFTVVGAFDVPGLGDYAQAGLEFDSAGRLWLVDRVAARVYQIASGEPFTPWSDIPWISAAPATASVNSGVAQPVVLTFEPGALSGGVYAAYLRLTNDTPYGAINVPLTMTVVALNGVQLTPPSTAAYGDPAATVLHTFVVTNTGAAADTFTVTLTGAEWPTQSPAAIGPLAPGASHTFTVAVGVPADSLCAASDSVTLTVTSRSAAQFAASAHFSTLTRAVYRAAMVAQPAVYTADPLAVIAARARVTNTGNCADTFSLSARGPWFGALPGLTANLPAGAAQDVTVTITVPVDAAAGFQAVTQITARSRTDAQAPAATTAFTTTVNAIYAGDFAPASAAAVVAAGAPAVYTFDLRNRSNAPLTFTLSAADATWPTQVSPATAALAAGKSLSVTVVVTAPAALADGAAQTARLVAVSPALTASARFTTTIGCAPVAGLSYQMAPARFVTGQPIVFTAAVLTGTAPITYTWNFGDGTQLAFGQTVTHTYQPETVIMPPTLTLTATNACGQAALSDLLQNDSYIVYMPVILKLVP